MTPERNIDFPGAMKALALEVYGSIYGRPKRVTDREMRFGANDRIWINLIDGTWKDHVEDKGGGVLDFLLEHKGLEKGAALDWLKRNGFLLDGAPVADMRKATPAPACPKFFDDNWLIRSGHKRVAVYDYAVEGEVLYQKVRYAKDGKKKFLIRHMGPDGQLYDGKAGAHGVLYRGDDLGKVADTTVFVCEGEKDADRLASHDMLAVSADNGAWTGEMIRKLAGFDCLILEDNDKTGREKAEKAAAALHGVATSVRVVRLPGLGDGEDISNWLGQGGDPSSVLDIGMASPIWQPPEPALPRTTTTACELPVIHVAPGDISRIADEMESALIKGNAPIYRRGSSLVMPVADEVPATDGRTTVAARLKVMTQPSLADHVARHARFERIDGRSGKSVNCNPPVDALAALMARDGEWKFPVIAGVVTTPPPRLDGTVMDGDGFDPVTRLFLVRDPDFSLPPIPERPTEADARASLKRLDDLLEGYLFVDLIDRSVILAALMTAVARPTMATAPMFVIKASCPGSGKSHAGDLMSMIGTGQICPVASAGKTEEELDKRLGAMLLQGAPIISLDNVNATELGGETLAQAAERPMVQIRILGQSKSPQVECRSLMLATGNNLVMREDMVRRVLVCRLDAKEERPELRPFAFDPIEKVLANRGRYVADVITIIRAYRAKGSPKQADPLGSYKTWSGMIRSPLMWLGQPDPVESMKTAREEDPVLCGIRELHQNWKSHLAVSEPYTARAIIDAACARMPVPTSSSDKSETLYVFSHPEFRDLLLRHAGDGGAINSRKLGKWLSSIKGRIVGGYRLDMKADNSHGSKFMLVEVGGVGAEPAEPKSEF